MCFEGPLNIKRSLRFFTILFHAVECIERVCEIIFKNSLFWDTLMCMSKARTNGIIGYVTGCVLHEPINLVMGQRS